MSNKQFLGYVAASYPIVWVNTHEYERAIKDLNKTVQKVGHKCFKWDIISGVTDVNNDDNVAGSNDDPTQPIEYVSSENKQVIFAQDYHLYLKSEQVWRKLLNDIPKFKSGANIFVIVSPVVDIPAEIERYVSVVDYELPDKNDLKALLSEVVKDMDIDQPENEEAIVNCGLGLTAFEFENSLCLSISTTGSIDEKAVYAQKEQLIRRNSTLQVDKFDGGFETIAGMENVKTFGKRMATNKNGRGILLLGVPGGGKSHYAKALGKETNRVTITLDFGNLMGSLVGETERKTREALKVIDAMSPCILFIDEIEKGLAGVSGHNGDSGTSQRQGGQFLKWLNDHESDVYVVATANDVTKLPPEFLRAERWDAIFFVDLPNTEEREAIFKLYTNSYEIAEEDYDTSNIENWTGAEIKTLCRLASSMEMSLAEAQQYVCPIYKTAEEKINNLRAFAKNRTIPASKTLQGVVASTNKGNGNGKRSIANISDLA